MKDQILRLEERFNSLTLRERVMVAAAALVVVAGLGWNLLVAPAWDRHSRLTADLAALAAQKTRVASELTVAQAEAAQDVDAELKQRLSELGRRIAGVEHQLQQAGKDLIPPEEMASVLRNILEEVKGLKLVSLSTLPSEPLVPIDAEGAPAELAQVNLYRHRLEVDFEGTYLAVLQYLQKLEGLGRPLFWDRFELVVASYPMARIRVRVHTLSLGQGLVGV